MFSGSYVTAGFSMYLGQYRQGDEVVVSVRAYTANPSVFTFGLFESSPALRVFQTIDPSPVLIDDTRRMAAYENAAFEGYFRLSIWLDDLYSTPGSYTAEVSWLSETAPYNRIVRYCPFEILPGGDDDGTITSLAEFVRPDKRFLMCGTTSGNILRRKNPRVAS